MITTATALNPLRTLAQHGQSVWLDYIHRDLLTGGALRRLIADDGVRGVTTNPAIFAQAITDGSAYADLINGAAPGDDATAVYERIAIRDVRDAADALADVYRESDRVDGYVSLEVSPSLADDADGTVAEARRLWAAVARRNVMIKVPATAAGIDAVRVLAADGINVNVTLIFAVGTYAAVADAWLSGLAARLSRGLTIGGVASVASVFVSRIDTAVDAALAGHPMAAEFSGRVAIANARLAYRHYQAVIESPRWQALRARGAQPQRLLWASTGTKRADLSDVVYVEGLVGADTVTTLPPATLAAFRDHGVVRDHLDGDAGAAAVTLRRLAATGVALDAITTRLLRDGLAQFRDAFDRLLTATAERLAVRTVPDIGAQTIELPPALQSAVDRALDTWQARRNTARLWQRDATLWTGADEHAWLGWLDAPWRERTRAAGYSRLAAEVAAEGVTHVLLIGMGGSSLCVEVLRDLAGVVPGRPELVILDSIDPAQIAAVERRLDLTRTLVVVASKSGGTLEPKLLLEYFYARVRGALGGFAPGRRFVAITDPGSALESWAKSAGVRAVVSGEPSIGGRYSALSPFGLAPAALIGLDLERLLDATTAMAAACGPEEPARRNPGVELGVVLGTLAHHGRDKVTIVTSPEWVGFGAWLEQLLAESTGKRGTGLVPIGGEPLGSPADYGDDRVFIHLAGDADGDRRALLTALAAAGHPVVHIDAGDVERVGQEFFRWEIATAVAGAVLGVNPFDQPDVEASKIATRKRTALVERGAEVPAEAPRIVDGDIAIYADDWNAAAVEALAGHDVSLHGYLGAHLRRSLPGDYVALLAYVAMTGEHVAVLQQMRRVVRDATHAATSVGFGPRYLHSTGQLYKGGPNSGLFLVITSDPRPDLDVPGRPLSFGAVQAAQALGDAEVLSTRARRALRLHITGDVTTGLARIASALAPALD